MTGTTLRITPNDSIRIVEETPELLAVEATYGRAGHPPPNHLHPAHDEHFTVLEGRLQTRVGGEARELAAGDELDVPRGVAHQMWSEHDGPVVVRWESRPAGRVGDWFRALDALHRADAFDGERLMALLAEYDDVFRLVLEP